MRGRWWQKTLNKISDLLVEMGREGFVPKVYEVKKLHRFSTITALVGSFGKGRLGYAYILSSTYVSIKFSSVGQGLR